jgi:hypothetical protein
VPGARIKVRNEVLSQRDVKNEGSSSEFIENKGQKKVLLKVY